MKEIDHPKSHEDVNTPCCLLIDDDPVTNAITEVVIKMAVTPVTIRAFTRGDNALEYLKSPILYASGKKNIIFLDLNMPIVTGWEFLEYFDNLNEEIKNTFRIYILSSSVDQRDKDRSYANKNVTSFLVKPITKEIAMQIFNDT